MKSGKRKEKKYFETKPPNLDATMTTFLVNSCFSNRDFPGESSGG